MISAVWPGSQVCSTSIANTQPAPRLVAASTDSPVLGEQPDECAVREAAQEHVGEIRRAVLRQRLAERQQREAVLRDLEVEWREPLPRDEKEQRGREKPRPFAAWQPCERAREQ